MPDNHWLFAVKVRDRPGTLTAVASVFSNRPRAMKSFQRLSRTRSNPVIRPRACLGMLRGHCVL